MGFLDDMMNEEKEHLEEALQRWFAEDGRVIQLTLRFHGTKVLPTKPRADVALWAVLRSMRQRRSEKPQTRVSCCLSSDGALRAQDPRLSSIEETDFEVSEVSEVPERSIWENRYGSVDESWARDPAEVMRALFKRENETKPVPPQQKLLCTAEQWDEAVAYRDLPPEQKATADAPVLAIALGWAPIPWSKP